MPTAAPPPAPSGLGLRADAVAMPRPGPAKAPARPGLKERCPRRLAARLAVAALVREWMRVRGVSTLELAEMCEESPSTLHDRLTGEKPMPAEIIALLPTPQRRRVCDLLAEVDLVVDAA